MKKAMIMSFMCVILLSSAMTPIQATLDQGTNPNQTFTYGADVGDEYIFNFFYNVSAGFDNESVYEEIYNWANETLLTEDLEELTDLARFIEGYTELINQDFQLKLDITQKYSDWVNMSGLNSYPDDPSYLYYEYDAFNASVRVRETGEEEWILPTEFSLNKVDEVADFAINILGIENDTEFQADQQEIADSISIVEELADFDELPVQRIQTKSGFYYENGTKYEFPSLLEDSHGLTAPQPPLDVYGSQGPVFFKPDEFHFDEWLVYAENYVNFLLEYAALENVTVPYENFDQVLAYSGVTTLEANENGIALVFNTARVNYTFLEEHTGLNFDPNDPNSDLPMSDFEALVHFAVEYDSDGILADYVLYYDFSAVIDTVGFNPEEELVAPDVPYIEDERFHIYIIASVYGDDYSMATPDQIAAGEVGEDRIPNSLFGDIPGYPIGVVSLLGLISVAGLLLKFKRK